MAKMASRSHFCSAYENRLDFLVLSYTVWLKLCHRKNYKKYIEQSIDFCKLLHAMHWLLLFRVFSQSFLAFFFAPIIN